jgi:hypothetical protein
MLAFVPYECCLVDHCVEAEAHHNDTSDSFASGYLSVLL